MRHYLLFFMSMFFLASCSVTKYVPEGKKLYQGTEIEFDGDVKLAEQQRVEEAINLSIYPRPNRKLLGLVYFNLWIYYNFDKSKDEWWAKLTYKRFAREPIYVEDVNIPLSEKIIKKEMQDEGYFNSKIEGRIIEKDKTAIIKYAITPTEPSIMGEIERPSDTTEVDSIVGKFRRFSVQEGHRYRQEAFEIERAQVTDYVRSKGFFDFKDQDIYYLVDTLGLDTVKVSMRIKSPRNDSIHRKYFIRNVNVYTTNGSFGSRSIENAKHQYKWKEIHIYEDFKYIDKKTLDRNILISPKSVFSIDDYNLTLSRLINLNVFKYVNIQYEKSATDSLDVNILLTPTAYKNIVYDGEVNTSDRSFLGSTLSTSFVNNNTFRKAEQFSASLKGGVELQAVTGDIQLGVLGLNAALRYEVPRLLVPFPTRKFRSSVSPKTILKVEDDFQFWLRYFMANSFNVLYAYHFHELP